MNIPTSSNVDIPASEQSTDSGVSEGEEYLDDNSIKQFVCLSCNSSEFKSRYQYEKHLLRHVCSPGVVLERLSHTEIKKVSAKQSATTPRKSASKCPPSYILPKFKGKHSPLKLTLKLAGESENKERSFEVVTPRKILLGPGERFVLNGGPLDCVKEEAGILKQEEDQQSVSGVEGSVEDAPAPEQSSGAERARSNTPGSGSDRGDNSGDGSSLQAQERDSPSSPQSSAAATNNGHDEEFEPPPGSFSPNMVQVNGTNVDIPSSPRSPAFPGVSPNLPDAEQHLSQHAPSEGDADTRDGHTISNTNENSNCGERNSGMLSEDTQHSSTGFSWTDVRTASMDGMPSTPVPAEERDPLMMPDQSQQGMMQGDGSAGSILGLGPPPTDGGDSSDPLLRGFLCEQPPADKTAVPVAVSEAGTMDGLGLGSEYISLERLGEGGGRVTAGALFCDVCGERAADHSALEEHRTRACHFKCTHTDCGGMVLPTADELLAHQNACHGGPPPPPQPMPYIQPVPVEQLAQQVQRLPVPAQSTQLQYMEPPNAACRPPPPLYRGPSPTQLSPQPPPPAYGQQIVYGQQQQQPQSQQQYQPQPQPPQYQPQPTPQQSQQRAYTIMPQQQTPQQRLQQAGTRLTAAGIGRGGGAQVSLVPQKRGAVPAGRGTSPNGKQRRLDVLLPAPNDDADCHVIAMQKRSDSGPVIGSVQGAVTGPGRSDMIQLTDSITLSVRNQKQGSSVNSVPVAGGRGRNNANEVANVLASRGITVTPAADTVRVAPVQTQNSPVRAGRGAAVVQQSPQQVPTLNLNAAISIIRTDNNGGSPVRQRQRPVQQTGTASFAVPQGRSPGRPQQMAQVERPPRPPTVDLTGDGPPHTVHHMPVRRGRGRGIAMGGRFTCQVCDKQFGSQEMLNQHMNVTHRSPPSKLPYRCNLCTAQYPTQGGLTQHRQTFHKEIMGSTELVIPVVDLKQAGALSRLASLGVHHYVPMQQLNGGQGTFYGLPLMSVDAGGRLLGSLPGTTGLSTGTVFNLGPLRQLPR